MDSDVDFNVPMRGIHKNISTSSTWFHVNILQVISRHEGVRRPTCLAAGDYRDLNALGRKLASPIIAVRTSSRRRAVSLGTVPAKARQFDA